MMLDAGAFSDNRVVDAAKNVVPILAKDTDLASKYGVRGYPTVKFTDPDGNEIGTLDNRSPQAVLDKINSIASKYKGKPGPIDEAIQSAKTDEKVLVVFFKDDKEPSVKTKEALGDESLKELLDKTSLSEVEFKKNSPEAKELKVISAPSIVILNPYIESPTKKPLAKLSGKKEAKDIKSALESAIKECDKARQKNKEGEELLDKALGNEDAKAKEKAIKEVISKFKGYAVAKTAKDELEKLKENK